MASTARYGKAWELLWIDSSIINDRRLADNCWWNACWVGHALERIGELAVPALLPLLENAENAGAAAATLSRMGRPAVPFLRAYLRRQHASREVDQVKRILLTLARMKTDATEALPEILMYARSEHALADTAISCLLQVCSSYHACVEAFAAELERVGPRAIDLIKESVDTVPSDVRDLVLRVLDALIDRDLDIDRSVEEAVENLSWPTLDGPWSRELEKVGTQAIPTLGSLAHDPERRIRSTPSEL